uniref:Uncharacterized protein n=1 Tax=Oryza brachyantha TaxID=4533 RepID=J3LYM7_ORYBR
MVALHWCKRQSLHILVRTLSLLLDMRTNSFCNALAKENTEANEIFFARGKQDFMSLITGILFRLANG